MSEGRRVKRVKRCDWQPLVDWLRKTMSLYRLKTPALAEETGVPVTTLYGLLNCAHRPSLETLEKLGTHFGQSLELMKQMAGVPTAQGLLRHVMPPATVVPGALATLLIPVIGSVSAGGGYIPEGYEVFGPIRGASKNLVAFRARGDCMMPRIHDGDLLIVDLNARWQEGRAVLARVGDELMVKFAYRDGSAYRLEPMNPEYGVVEGTDIEILGVVVASQSEMVLVTPRRRRQPADAD